jgi:mannose-6-phosphate isomerase class I
MLGPAAPSPDSPLLIKVLFAREKLSVQVHPDDNGAEVRLHPAAKPSAGIALAAEPRCRSPSASSPASRSTRSAAASQTAPSSKSLNIVPVAAGDMIFVDAGTVHAIWPGAILETQQNCDLTYRMFDYGRPRELHIEKSLEAMRLPDGCKIEAAGGKPSPLPKSAFNRLFALRTIGEFRARSDYDPTTIAGLSPRVSASATSVVIVWRSPGISAMWLSE